MVFFAAIPIALMLGAATKMALSSISLGSAAAIAGVAAAGTAVGLIGGGMMFFKNSNSGGFRDIVHPYSELAATNWTQPSVNGTHSLGLVKSLVFYQDTYNSIIVTSRSHPHAPWVSVNVTDEFSQRGQPISARGATPLAVSAKPGAEFEAVLYFLNSANKTVEIRTKDHSLRAWVKTDLGDSPGVRPDYFTQLGAHWFDCSPHCEDNTNQVRLFFQKGDQLLGATSSPFVETGFISHMTPGSGIVPVPFMPPDGPLEMRVFFDEAARIMMMRWKNGTGWMFDEDFFLLPKDRTFPGQSIAAATFPAPIEYTRPAWYIVVLQLRKCGQIRATYWDPHNRRWVDHKKARFKGGPFRGQFTRIALTQDGKFYGFKGRHLEEYTIDPKKPTKFRHASRVTLRPRVRKENVRKDAE